LKYFSRLSVNVYDFDTPASNSLGITPILGPAYRSYAAEQNSLPLSTPHVGYNIIDVSTISSEYPDGVWSARDDVLKKKCWAAIVIHSNATASWRNALENGQQGYDSQGSVGIYYEGARYYQIVLLYLRPFVSSHPGGSGACADDYNNSLMSPHLLNSTVDQGCLERPPDRLANRPLHHPHLPLRLVHPTLAIPSYGSAHTRYGQCVGEPGSRPSGDERTFRVLPG